jgi:hypothetical protein
VRSNLLSLSSGNAMSVYAATDFFGVLHAPRFKLGTRRESHVAEETTANAQGH